MVSCFAFLFHQFFAEEALYGVTSGNPIINSLSFFNRRFIGESFAFCFLVSADACTHHKRPQSLGNASAFRRKLTFIPPIRYVISFLVKLSLYHQRCATRATDGQCRRNRPPVSQAQHLPTGRLFADTVLTFVSFTDVRTLL